MVLILHDFKPQETAYYFEVDLINETKQDSHFS